MPPPQGLMRSSVSRSSTTTSCPAADKWKAAAPPAAPDPTISASWIRSEQTFTTRSVKELNFCFGWLYISLQVHPSHNGLLIIAIFEFKLGRSGKLTPCRDPVLCAFQSSAQGSVEVPPKHNYLSTGWSVGGHGSIFSLALTAQFPQARYECRMSVVNL